MPWFIKTERFTQATLNLSSKKRSQFLAEHKSWIKNMQTQGKRIISGYLVNQKKEPGGGGLLVIEAESYQDAIHIIEQDPMIKNNLVKWTLQEWVLIENAFNNSII
ncbi:YciI family protein [Prochlorococcus sp. MIT 1223]|uniref:YciI family protein n=1 Tax=Prochlorococcus sp. MIT 1223 TaxID=3096217 RepID=UPI002A765D9A|nr:YciI family protein [Prochlorococcus sp. MIT 1223]|tara:strand:- start:426 stop:743 length:318 start_codon:yes stop_codon:yes gene_type:complete